MSFKEFARDEIAEENYPEWETICRLAEEYAKKERRNATKGLLDLYSARLSKAESDIRSAEFKRYIPALRQLIQNRRAYYTKVIKDIKYFTDIKTTV